ncbi:glycosyltransferase [Nodularia harveyana UHCC-0300]|uniref:Glycosyltransferase n=1 Tax=Nodularia harveyana UHCC-0300 TaxID=2974287 RepID=A0ABU5UH16_9CYAN|nr:glycosyltransferase [Nodularia harveyana]MEA5582847.1 glycosyltransferase [Nodularia harveyana UHCC-0300]
MTKLHPQNMIKIHVLYEHSQTASPHGSSFIRLLLPLTYPTNQNTFLVSQGTSFQSADVIIVERTWKSNISLSAAEELVRKVRKNGACLIYSIDDNLLDLKFHAILQNELPNEKLMVIRYLAREADGIIVSTHYLKQRLSVLNPNIFVVPNALDERLVESRISPQPETPNHQNSKKVIGYMGTRSHDDDLMMILQALRTTLKKYSGQLELQLIGSIADISILKAFNGLSVKVIDVAGNDKYPDFMRWMSQNVQWDLAIAPLEDNLFTRCKSDIKFLDYSALAIPGIYSDVPSYQNTIRHLETGYLAENHPQAWIKAFDSLLNDHILRQKLAKQAQEYVLSTRTLKHCAQDWQDAILAIINTLS